MRHVIALSLALLFPLTAMAVDEEYKWENCIGVGNFKMNSNVCRITDLVTRETEWTVTIGVGVFLDTQVVGQGLEGHSALIGTYTFTNKEAKNADDARAKAEALFAKSKQLADIGAQSAPMCSAQAETYADATKLIREWAIQSKPPELMCKPKS